MKYKPKRPLRQAKCPKGANCQRHPAILFDARNWLLQRLKLNTLTPQEREAILQAQHIIEDWLLKIIYGDNAGVAA